MIDLHCHILPEIDDGSRSLDESKEMLEIASDEGIRVIAATHHFDEYDDTVDEYLDKLDKGIERLQPVLKSAAPDIRIVKGAEVFISPFLAGIDGLERLCINGSRYLLMELPMSDIPQYTDEVIYNLQLRGIVPIIAHPERNMRIRKRPELMYRFVKQGALGQVTTTSITGLFGREVQGCAKALLKHNLVHVLGSDAHSPHRRAPLMTEAAKTLEKWIDTDAADAIIYKTPDAIIKDSVPDLPSPLEPVNSFITKLFKKR